MPGCGSSGAGPYTVSVTVTGLGTSNNGLTLRNNGADDLNVLVDGSFAFSKPLASGSAYSVTVSTQPTQPDQTCTVANGVGTIGNANITNVAINCSPTVYAVGGTVSGLAGGSVSLVYYADNLPLPYVKGVGNGTFVFDASVINAVSGTSYRVAIEGQPINPAQTCSFTDPGAYNDGAGTSGTVGNADVTNLALTCGPLGMHPPCAPYTGAGTTLGSVAMAQTWTEAGSPYTVPFDIEISAPVTIEPCAVIRIVKGGTVTINSSGSLIAEGLLGQPVTFEALVPGMAWSSIRNFGGTLSLTHAVLNGGGDPLNTIPAYAGALHMQSPSTIGTFHVDDVEIAGSLSQGVYINGAVGFDATSQNLRVHGSVGFPVHVYARVLGSIPTGDYTGNGIDEIGIAGSGGPVGDAQTMHDRGVPYHVGSGQDGGRMDITSQASGQVALLTIEPGVTVRFPPGGTLNVDPSNGTTPALGALIAIGTPTQQIVFTSDQPAPLAGDWLGIGFGNAVDPRSTLQNVRVEFAGGPGTGSNSCPYPGRVGQNDAAIRIFGPPSTQFITNTEIVSSARDGIDRGWRADLQPDFLATNTFTAVTGCKESTPRTLSGSCPAAPSCP